MDVKVILLPVRSTRREERPLPTGQENGCLTPCLLVLVNTNFSFPTQELNHIFFGHTNRWLVTILTELSQHLTLIKENIHFPISYLKCKVQNILQ